MSVKLLTEYHLEFLSLKGGCTGSSESTLDKMPHCKKSRVTAQIQVLTFSLGEVNKLFLALALSLGQHFLVCKILMK